MEVFRTEWDHEAQPPVTSRLVYPSDHLREPVSVIYTDFKSGLSSRPFGATKSSATACTTPVFGSNRYALKKMSICQHPNQSSIACKLAYLWSNGRWRPEISDTWNGSIPASGNIGSCTHCQYPYLASVNHLVCRMRKIIHVIVPIKVSRLTNRR